MNKTKVGILFGGASPEHEVLSSAQGIVSNIDKNKFKPVEIFIDRKGDFWFGKNIIRNLIDKKEVNLRKANFNLFPNKIDVAFPVLHGEGGEDGSIQGFLKILKMPFVGSDIMASALCLDKAIFSQLAKANGILKPRFEIVDSAADDSKKVNNKIRSIKNILKFPLFVKPSRAGSSVGITKVKTADQLFPAIKKAGKFDNKILIEESVEGCREIEVSTLGNKVGSIKLSLPGEVIPGSEFYDYEDKYKDDKAKFNIPVKLSKNISNKIEEIVLKAYEIAGCRGLARVDLFLDKKGRVYLNEINTMPGFTRFSMYPRMWEVSGTSYKEIITKLIELALRNN